MKRRSTSSFERTDEDMVASEMVSGHVSLCNIVIKS